jgi:hypothetical protein
LVIVVMLGAFTGMMLAPIFGSAESSWPSPSITIPRHDPLAADSDGSRPVFRDDVARYSGMMSPGIPG